jgi:fatty acid-binding protein DegV
MAGLGGLLQIKPILTMFDGKPGTDRVRTFERAKKRLLEMLSKVGALERLAIVHTHAPDRVAELRALVTSEMTDNDIIVADITPVIGTHIGPGAYGFAAIGK